jgi:hypothetical protein
MLKVAISKSLMLTLKKGIMMGNYVGETSEHQLTSVIEGHFAVWDQVSSDSILFGVEENPQHSRWKQECPKWL